MTATSWLRALAAVFVAALLQVVIVSSLVVEGGAPGLLLVVVVALGLLRGTPIGAKGPTGRPTSEAARLPA